MKVGAPEKDIDGYTAVEVQELVIFVPNVRLESEGPINIVDLRKRNGAPLVGILEPK